METKTESTRVVVVGAGLVGSTAAFAMMAQGVASEIVLIDVNKEKSEGEALDLQHGISFTPAARVWAGTYEDCKDADVIVITAGVGQKAGQKRLELADTNAKIVKEIIQNIKQYTREAIILVVSNPLDVMTQVALVQSGFPRNQIFGTGTTLDSSRFRYALGGMLDVAADSVGAYILGEHGDSEVAVVSHANVMGEPIQNLPHYDGQKIEDIFAHTKNAAYEIIQKKGATYYAIALVIARLVRAILFDEKHVFPVSTLLEGEYGISGVCISVPAVIGRKGIVELIPVKLSNEELQKLQQSAQTVKGVIDAIQKTL